MSYSREHFVSLNGLKLKSFAVFSLRHPRAEDSFLTMTAGVGSANGTGGDKDGGERWPSGECLEYMYTIQGGAVQCHAGAEHEHEFA